MRLTRKVLAGARPEAVIRLAKYVGVPMTNTCTCVCCLARLGDRIVRELDTWPPRLTERQW